MTGQGPHLSYREIAAALEADIRGGVWRPGDWLPRNPDLAKRFGVSLTTLQRALGLLEERSLISRHQGKGVQVRELGGTRRI